MPTTWKNYAGRVFGLQDGTQIGTRYVEFGRVNHRRPGLRPRPVQDPCRVTAMENRIPKEDVLVGGLDDRADAG